MYILFLSSLDRSQSIVGTDTYNYDVQKAKLRLIDQCTNLQPEGLLVEVFYRR